jgi:hypothetical protein
MEKNSFDKATYDILARDSQGLFQEQLNISKMPEPERPDYIEKVVAPKAKAFFQELIRQLKPLVESAGKAEDASNKLLYGPESGFAGPQGLRFLARRSDKFGAQLEGLYNNLRSLVGKMGEPVIGVDSIEEESKPGAISLLLRTSFFNRLGKLIKHLAHADNTQLDASADAVLKYLEALNNDITLAVEQPQVFAKQRAVLASLDKLAASLEEKGLRGQAELLDTVANTLEKSAGGIEVMPPFPEKRESKVIEPEEDSSHPQESRFSEEEGTREEDKSSKNSTKGTAKIVQDGYTDQGYRPMPSDKPPRRNLTNETDSREWRREYQKEYRQQN